VVAESVQRLVLKPHVTESDFELAAWEHNWLIREMGEEEAGALVDTWATADGGTIIRFVNDSPIGLNYVRVHGDAADLVAQQIREDLELWSVSEALDALRKAESLGDKRVALFAAALTAPVTPDHEVVGRLRDAAADPDVNLRRSFVEAVGYLPWPQLVEHVDELSRNDPDPVVRDDARLLLEGIRLHGTE
jgi:hypothetical protein